MAFVYSCCFWFSLRLGGILIGIFSLLQALVVLTACCMAHTHPEQVKEDIIMWTNDMKLIYTKDYFSNIILNFETFIAFCISITSMYILTCVLFIYGAFMFNNMLMVAFIVVELMRLLVLSAVVITGLLVLKQNTMDIGLLIGASVAGGFLLCELSRQDILELTKSMLCRIPLKERACCSLFYYKKVGMFYLWVCALNLPVLVNEMERDEQAATIAKLRQVIEMSNSSKAFTQGLDDIPLAGNSRRRGSIFTVLQKQRSEVNTRMPESFYSKIR